MQTLVIGDLHGNSDALMDVLRRAGALTKTDKKRKDWRIISVGDMANLAKDPEFRGFVSYDLRTLELAERYVDTITVGNHEVYWTHHLAIGNWYGMAETLTPDVAYQLYKMVGHEYGPEGLFQAAAEAHGWVISHAGLHARYQQHFSGNPEEVAETLNRMLAERALGKAPATYVIDGDDGIFWMRPPRHDKYEESPRLKQIVGHTPDKNHPWYDPDRQILYIDTGGYFSNSRGSGIVYDQATNKWEEVA